ncbi:MAG TPA: 50S ribosomal protein L11 methyltransferase [Gammaproteobacteria bacterium]
MPWQELTFFCESDNAVALSDWLTGAGAVSVSLSDGSGEAIIESDTGVTPLWRKTQVRGLFDAGAALDGLVGQLKEAGYAAPSVTAVDDRDWEHAWRQHVSPRRFGRRLWVLPSFAEASPEQRICVRLDPGLAFGTGAHPTTALCLEWLDEAVKPGDSMVDYGCGSGILAIAAVKLGAERVHAVDTDPRALETARRNAVHNDCAQAIEFHDPASLPRQPADLLVANIFANPLMDLRQELGALLRPGGHIALSGILLSQAEAVAAAFNEGFALEPVTTRDNWACISGCRQSTAE